VCKKQLITKGKQMLGAILGDINTFTTTEAACAIIAQKTDW